MKCTINPSLGVHACGKCAWTLTDADFNMCGVQITAELGFCFDYRCPKCDFLGRWTIGLASEERIRDALDMLKNIVRDESETRPRRTPVFLRNGNRLSGDLFDK